MFEYYGNINVYYPGGAGGHMSPLGPIFFRIINIQSYYLFPARFSPQMTFFLSFPHSNALATYVDLVVK